jgi:hypothetical protein
MSGTLASRPSGERSRRGAEALARAAGAWEAAKAQDTAWSKGSTGLKDNHESE